MNCAESIELLSDYYEDALDGTVRIEIKSHLIECPECAEVFHDIEIIVRSSSSLRSFDMIVFPDENLLWQRIDQSMR